MEDLATSRQEIDKLDRQLLKLLEMRFDVVTAVGQYKRQHHLPVLDTNREQQVLAKVASLTDREDLLPYLQAIYQNIMQQSREYQAQQRKDEAK